MTTMGQHLHALADDARATNDRELRDELRELFFHQPGPEPGRPRVNFRRLSRELRRLHTAWRRGRICDVEFCYCVACRWREAYGEE